MKTITIFGSSRPLQNEEEYTFAFNLGKELASHGFAIVTGGYGGIMEAASRGAFENNGLVYGVTVSEFKRLPNKFLTEEIRCANLMERLQKLISMGDGYAALQGGTGTLLELAAVWELINKKSIPPKPFAAHSEIWEKIIPVMNKQMELEKRDSNIINLFKSPVEIAEYFRNEFNLV